MSRLIERGFGCCHVIRRPDVSELLAVGGNMRQRLKVDLGDLKKICITSWYMGCDVSFEIYETVK